MYSFFCIGRDVAEVLTGNGGAKASVRSDLMGADLRRWRLSANGCRTPFLLFPDGDERNPRIHRWT
jgi:hypothetical protein